MTDKNEQVRGMMQKIARTVDSMIPEGFGFGVLVFEFDKTGEEPSGKEMHWVSNARRDDVARAMQEFVKREGN